MSIKATVRASALANDGLLSSCRLVHASTRKYIKRMRGRHEEEVSLM
jgi:hypothetical protein